MDDPQPLSVDDLVHELRIRVAARRKEGFYPDGLEQDLEEHFRRVVAHRSHPDLATLRHNLETLDVTSAFSPARIATDSALPGGAAIHRVVSKIVSRQTQGILDQVQQFADVVRDSLAGITDLALEDGPDRHFHADLVGQLDAIFERLAVFERGPSHPAAAVADLRRRVENLEAAEQRRQFTPSYTNDAFESAFRGSREEMAGRYVDLAALFAGRGPVLDIGCGRGEFLELLGEAGVAARGIELDPVLAAEGCARGLEVEVGDAITSLAALPDASLGGIVLIQVVEHLGAQAVTDLVAIAHDKLVAGGLMVVETVNPQSLYTFAHAFYIDPTHMTPIHPAYLKFLFDQAGYSSVGLDWRSPPPADDILEIDEGAGEIQAANVRRLNQLLFAPQDYALVAVR